MRVGYHHVFQRDIASILHGKRIGHFIAFFRRGGCRSLRKSNLFGECNRRLGCQTCGICRVGMGDLVALWSCRGDFGGIFDLTLIEICFGQRIGRGEYFACRVR